MPFHFNNIATLSGDGWAGEVPVAVPARRVFPRWHSCAFWSETGAPPDAGRPQRRAHQGLHWPAWTRLADLCREPGRAPGRRLFNA